MENKECNSFYDNDSTKSTDTLTVLPNNSTGKKTEETTTEQTKPATVKKKSTLWIWAASYLAAIIISPSQNPNYSDDSTTNVTP